MAGKAKRLEKKLFADTIYNVFERAALWVSLVKKTGLPRSSRIGEAG
jgi:hypothetical protein